MKPLLKHLINKQTNYVLTCSTRTLQHVHNQVTNHSSLDPREPFLCHRPYLVVFKLIFEHFYLENRLNCEHFEIHKSPRAHKVTHDCGFGSSAVCDSAVVRSRPSSFRTACGEQKEWTKKWFARLNWSAGSNIPARLVVKHLSYYLSLQSHEILRQIVQAYEFLLINSQNQTVHKMFVVKTKLNSSR